MISQLKNSKRQINSLVKRNIYKYFPRLDPNYPIKKGQVNFIFIHINKTGGSSIGKVIGFTKKNHRTAKTIIKIVGKENWEKSYKFTFVRNPWDKVVSHYQFRVQGNQTNLRDNPISFTEWVKCTYGDNKNTFYYDKPSMFRPQNEWLLNDQNEIDIDMIGRFENLNEDFKIIADQIGCNPILPHINKTKKVDYKEFYNSETKNIITKWFEKDIELFKYKF